MDKLNVFVVRVTDAGATSYEVASTENDALNLYIARAGSVGATVDVFHVRTGRVKWTTSTTTEPATGKNAA